MIFLLLWMIFPAAAKLPPVFDENAGKLARSSDLTRTFLTPVRIVWLSDTSGQEVQNAPSILKKGIGQADLNQGKYLTLVSTGGNKPGILLDFGREIHGGLEIVTTINNSNSAGKVRVRFGESVSEAMTDAEKTMATNDHAVRDQ